MKTTDYQNLVDLTYVGGGFVPANQKARELIENCTKGEVVTFEEITQRDLKFHKCYFSLLNMIYDYLPERFHREVSRDFFYRWLQHLKGNFEIIYTFKDGSMLLEYESISFGRMSEKRFHEYVKEQLPFIYENVIGKFFEGIIYQNIIKTIEEDYKKFFAVL